MLLPAVRDRVAVRVAAGGRQRKGSARWNHEVTPRFDGRRAVPCRGNDGTVRAETHGSVELDFLDADKVKEGIAMQLQIIRSANACVPHDGRAAAWFVSGGSVALPVAVSVDAVVTVVRAELVANLVGDEVHVE